MSFTTPLARRLATYALAAACVGLTACASLPSAVTAQVSSFGQWPAGRAAGTYAFDRLPSQQGAAATGQARLEELARPALARAGFTEAAAGQAPQVLVQVGLREDRTLAGPWADPLWWHGGFGYRWPRHAYGAGFGFSGPWASTTYEAQAAVLIRDRESGKPLFEAHAADSSRMPVDARTVAGLFAAALMDFPKTGINPRAVTVPLAAPAAASAPESAKKP